MSTFRGAVHTYQYFEDYFLWYNMAKAGARFYIEPQVLVGLRQHNNQISQLFKNDMALNSQFLRRDIIIDLLVDNNAPELIETAKNLFNFYRYNELDMENYFDYFYSISSLCNAKNLKGTNGLSLITNT